ncbi:MAG: anthranilate synthase component I family protein [bacterium]|nr:anthranilate synthase component I family protein [bacterium]
MASSAAVDRGQTLAVPVQPHVHTFRRGHFAAPSRLCERLRQAGVRDAGLLARREADGSDEVLVVARALLRIELRDDVLRVRSLEPAARPLLPRLAEALGTGAVAAAVRSVVIDGDELVAALAESRPVPGQPDDEVLRAPSCFDPLRAVLGLLADSRPGVEPAAGLLGAFGYELIDRFEDLGPRRPDPLAEPDYSFVLASDLVLYDEANGRVSTVVRGLPWERASAVEARIERLAALGERAPEGGREGEVERTVRGERNTRDAANAEAPFESAFGAGVTTLLEHIRRGDIYQAVLSRPIALASTATPLAVLRALGGDTPWRFAIPLGRGELVGASPETCLAVTAGELELRPLAGTLPRGIDVAGRIDPDLDQRLAVQLMLDTKEQAEHAMLVDLARNDVARVSAPGSTRLTEAFTILRMPRVQHLASRVRGQLRPGLDALHAYRAVMNMGTLTGAPKPMAMRLVRSLEPTARGFYGGAVGYLGTDGALRTCIAIRTLRHDPDAGCYHARAGAGVVYDSVPEREFAETEHKLAQLRRAIAEVGR